MELSAHDEALLAGHHGPATRMAMTIITRMAEVQGAERLLDITAAHCDSTIYMGPATLEFANASRDWGHGSSCLRP